MSTVLLQVGDLKALRKVSRANGTLDAWGDVAEQWADAANAEVLRLTAERDEALARIEPFQVACRNLDEKLDAALALLREIGINCGICMACGRIVSKQGHDSLCKLVPLLKEAL